MVALSEYVMKKRLKRHLAEKSRWRHIRLAIKLHYIGNHASQIKSYNGTLSGSHDRSFRISSWKIAWSAPRRRNHDDVISSLQYNIVISENMPPRQKVTMERYQEVMVALPESVIKNRLKLPLAEDWRWRHVRLAIKPHYLANHASRIKFTMERYREVMVPLSESMMKNRVKHPMAEDWRWRHVRLAMKHCYLGNHASQIKSYYGSLSWSLGH